MTTAEPLLKLNLTSKLLRSARNNS